MLNNKIIRASAGTGKTFQLSNRYIELLSEGVPIETILAATFTRNAAGEILERILRRLAEAALDDAKSAKLSGEIYGEGNERKLTREKVLKTLGNLARNLHRTRISTIDSFFGQIAVSFAPELGFPIEWRIADEIVNYRNQQRAICEAFNDPNSNVIDLVYDFFKGESQRTLTAEISDILENDLSLFRETEKNPWFCVEFDPRKIFSDQERDSRIEAIQKGIEETYRQIPEKKKGGNHAASFLKTGNNLIAAYGSVRRETAAENTLFINVNQKGKNTYYSDITLSTTFTDAIEEIEEDVGNSFLRNLKQQTESTYELIAEIAEKLETIKSGSGEYSFDDIPYYLEKALQRIRGERLDFRLDAKINHLLLDEFQDTSIFQWKILEPIADTVIRADSPIGTDSDHPRCSFFCVGDTKQAIYQWRGGMPEIFRSVESKYQRYVNEVTLSENRRSSPVVLQVVNAVFESISRNECVANLLKKPDEGPDPSYIQKRNKTVTDTVKSWQDAFKHHEFPKDNEDLAGFVSLEAHPRLSDLSAEQIDWIAQHLGLKSEQVTGNISGIYTAWRIKKLHQEKPNASIGVLFRRGKPLAETAEILKQIGVEVSQEGGTPLSTAESVRAVIALLRVAEHSGDTAALLRIATFPALAQILPAGCRPFSGDFTEEKSFEKKAQKLSLYIRNRIITEGLGSFVREAANALLPFCDGREKEKLRAFVDRAFQFEGEKETRIDRFIHLIETQKVSLPGDSNIHLITIHGAKGLEYDIVLLPELGSQKCNLVSSSDDNVVYSRPVDSSSPQPQPSIESPDLVFRYVSKEYFAFLPNRFHDAYIQNLHIDINSSLNLLYVAMTRAKRELIMIVSPLEKDSKGNLKKPTSCNFQNILRTQLEGSELHDVYEPLKIGEEIVYQNGTPDWYSQENPKDISLGDESLQSHAPLISIRRHPMAASLGKEQRAPSDHGFQRQWSYSRTLFDRGTAIHGCFEQIQWLDHTQLDRDFFRKNLIENVFRGQKPPANLEEIIDGFFALCNDATVKKILSPASYGKISGNHSELEVYRERSYIAVSESNRGRVHGIIDRLVLQRQNGIVVAADIIDYKTNSDVPEDPEELRIFVQAMHYDEQLNHYRREIEKMYTLAPGSVTARLLFTDYKKEEQTGEIKPIVRLFTVHP